MHSCVSKKKFVEMQDGRLKAEEQVRQLTEETNYRASRIEALIADFEEMKNELLESNAMKDQYIDSLNTEISGLNELLTEQKESLQETSFSFGFEQQRMKEELENKDANIRALRAQVKNLEEEISDQSTVIDDKNFQLNLHKDEISSLESKVNQVEQQREQLQQELQKVKTETENLRAEIEEKDAAIERLQNNVNLLKKELGGEGN
jgi:chromosome segregation ATPase